MSADATESARSEAAPGLIFVLSAPSGAGKTTLCNLIRDHFGDLSYSVSYTTRSPRPGEADGRDYFFIDADAFRRGIETGRWAEWARVHGNYYGTSAEWIAQTLAAGRDILMDIDVQGARQIVARFPQAVTIFVMPPSFESLRQRILHRGGDDPATVELRLVNATDEMAQKDFYRHIVVNDQLPTAARELIDLLQGYRDRRGGAA
jgi:guanylate kinase